MSTILFFNDSKARYHMDPLFSKIRTGAQLVHLHPVERKNAFLAKLFLTLPHALGRGIVQRSTSFANGKDANVHVHAAKTKLRIGLRCNYDRFALQEERVSKKLTSKLKKNALKLSNNETENIFLFNFLIYLQKINIEKKDIYWPIIVSILPISFQRRIVKICLLNQNKKNIQYSQIEDFLTVNAKLYQKNNRN